MFQHSKRYTFLVRVLTAYLSTYYHPSMLPRNYLLYHGLFVKAKAKHKIITLMLVIQRSLWGKWKQRPIFTRSKDWQWHYFRGSRHLTCFERNSACACNQIRELGSLADWEITDCMHERGFHRLIRILMGNGENNSCVLAL